mmetsp:Transcript_11285/g.27743  ORF Transcript_11285/g.27743 Transcript_11285/m.27743 type:complete len:221 (-) Transcript_11285:134-796(-)
MVGPVEAGESGNIVPFILRLLGLHCLLLYLRLGLLQRLPARHDQRHLVTVRRLHDPQSLPFAIVEFIHTPITPIPAAIISTPRGATAAALLHGIIAMLSAPQLLVHLPKAHLSPQRVQFQERGEVHVLAAPEVPLVHEQNVHAHEEAEEAQHQRQHVLDLRFPHLHVALDRVGRDDEPDHADGEAGRGAGAEEREFARAVVFVAQLVLLGGYLASFQDGG